MALVLILAPVAAVHPVITHLYSAGFKSFPIEFTHPSRPPPSRPWPHTLSRSRLR